MKELDQETKDKLWDDVQKGVADGPTVPQTAKGKPQLKLSKAEKEAMRTGKFCRECACHLSRTVKKVDGVVKIVACRRCGAKRKA